MSRERVPGDGPKCWCGGEAVWSGYCAAHCGELGNWSNRPPIDPPAPITLALVDLPKVWRGAAEACRQNAHTDNGLSAQSKAIFSGRSDAYENCADLLEELLK